MQKPLAYSKAEKVEGLRSNSIQQWDNVLSRREYKEQSAAITRHIFVSMSAAFAWSLRSK